jgi:hypothetical protein
MYLPSTLKKFAAWVRPGVFDANANPVCPVSLFNSVDFPTFDLPKNATSGSSG